jgi:catechol 2,3-dioxygenase-like lactoylglutathione lyase family enzyme
MLMKTYIAIIPSADLERSLRFWVEGLGMTADQKMYTGDKLVGCMVHDERLYCWLNQRAETSEKTGDPNGISLYWTPEDIHKTRTHLLQLGFGVSDIIERDYGQTEFFVTDDDGHSHCFGVATNK